MTPCKSSMCAMTLFAHDYVRRTPLAADRGARVSGVKNSDRSVDSRREAPLGDLRGRIHAQHLEAALA